jgi:hypothetical protein
MYVTSWFNRDSCRFAGRREAEDRQKISDAPHGPIPAAPNEFIYLNFTFFT